MPRGPGEDAPSRTAAVCVATMDRPQRLATLLAALAAQHPVPEITWHVVVVDGDEHRSAEPVVADARARSDLTIEYVPERPGLARARNTCVRHAGAADWIVFVDDDEIPAPDWLAALFAAQVRSGADAVTGPVDAAFESLRGAWLVGQGPFSTWSFPTGTRRPTASTGNVLVRRARLGPEPFDADEFPNAAEDTDCFLRFTQAGGDLVWCEEARVTHQIPRARQTVGWMARRTFRDGRAWTRAERRYWPGLRPRLRRAGAGTVHVGLGAAVALGGVLRCRRATAVRGLLRVAGGSGQLSGLLGRGPRPAAPSP